MLGNNLALGMALQGTPKDYSTMVVAAKKLGQAAEAKKAAEAEKKRQKIMSEFSREVGDARILDFRRPQVDGMVADFYTYLTDNEDVDLSKVYEMKQKIAMNMNQFGAERRDFELAERQGTKVGIPDDEFFAVRTAQRPEDIVGKTKFFQLNKNGSLAIDAVPNFKSVRDMGQEFITKNGQYIFNNKTPKQAQMGKKTITYFDIPEDARQGFIDSTLSDPSRMRSVRREMKLDNIELLPENTPEALAQVKGYVTEKFNDLADNFLKGQGVTTGSGLTINNNLGGEKANPIQPNAGNLTKVKIRTKTKEGNNYDNVTSFTYRILNATPNKRNINPNDVEIIDTETGRAGGKPKGELGNGAIDLLAVFTRPYTTTFTLPGGQKETVQFNKGDMAPDFLMTSDMSNYIQMKPYQIGIDINDKTYYIPFGSADELAMVLNEKKSNEGFTSTMMDVVNKSKADLQSQIGQGMDKFYSNFENFLGKSVKPQQGQNTIQQNINEVGKTGKLPSQQKAMQPAQSKTGQGDRKTKAQQGLQGF
jgi:hypothetical protein